MPSHRPSRPLPMLLLLGVWPLLALQGCAPTAAGAASGSMAGGAPAPAAPSASGLDADQRDVLETVETIFRGMRTADSTLIRSVFAPDARFAMLTEDGARVRYAPIDGWLRAVADSERRWDERVYDVEIRVDRPIATAWTPYTFYLDGRVRHCGVNAIELLRTADGWRVTQLSDSRRPDGCPDPLPMASAQDGGVTAFVGVDVVPMDSERVLRDHTVLVRDGRIEWVGPAGSAQIPAGARRVDGRGRYLIPGLAEMHAHIPGGNAPQQLVDDIMFLYVANGITTIRGMLGAPVQLEMRDRAARNEILAPSIIVGAPSLNGNSAPDPQTARRLVRQYADEGYDFLKLHPGLSREVYDAAVEEARRVGITTGGHISAGVGLHRTLEAGQGTIDHLDGYAEAAVPDALRRRILAPDQQVAATEMIRSLDESMIPRLAAATREAGVYNVPTAALWETFYLDEAPEALAERPEMRYVPRSMVEGWIRQKQGMAGSQAQQGITAADARRLIDFRRRVLRGLADAGAPLLLGTDSPQLFSVPGFSLHREAALMQEVGISPFTILESGSRNVARYANEVIGLDDRFGVIAPGYRADLVLVAANPLADVAALRDVHGVMVRGEWVDRQTIEARLREMAARNAAP